MATPTDFKLGEKVVVSAVCQRKQRRMNNANVFKWWEVKPIEPRVGIYAGWRTIANGEREFVGIEKGFWFVPTTHLRVALVVFSDRQNYVRVPLDSISSASDDDEVGRAPGS